MPCINQGYKDDVMGNIGPPLQFAEIGRCTHANSFCEIECAQHIWCTTIISVCKHLWRKEKRKAIKSLMHCILVSTIGHTYFAILVAKYMFSTTAIWFIMVLYNWTYQSFPLTNVSFNDILALIIFLSSFEVHQTCHGSFLFLIPNVQCIFLWNFKMFAGACLDNQC